MNAKLVILGCGSSLGVPRIDGFWGNINKSNKKNIRTRCSSVIVKGSNNILIDASPDIRNQLLDNKIKDISSVILTHEHADQTNGLFELRPFFWKNNKKINIYGSSKTLKIVKNAHGYLFNGSKGYPPIFNSNIVKKKFTLGNYKQKVFLKTTTVTHGQTNSTAYIFEKTAYISDCNDLSIVDNKQFKNLNTLIIDCLKYDKHPSHYSFNEVLFIHYYLKPKKTILTNLFYDMDYDMLVKKLPNNIKPAYDGMKIDL